MAISFVNSATGNASAATVPTGAFVATTGNAIFVGISASVKLASGVTDTAGNAYVKALDNSSQTGGNVSIWYALNITGNASNIVTASFGGTGGSCNISVHQVSGIAASNALDQIKPGSGNTGTAVTTGASPATVQANEYVFAVGGANATQTWTVGTGYSNLVTNVNGTQTHAVEGKIVSATGAQTATFTLSASGVWGAALATFSDTAILNPPTVTTQAVTSVTASTAVGNASITATGGANADERGVVYDTATKALPGNVAPGSSGYGFVANETGGSFGTGAYTESMVNLRSNATYFVRGYAHNSQGYSYGSEVSFTTPKAVSFITNNLRPHAFSPGLAR